MSEKTVNVIVVPLIDSQNPPISADSVVLGAATTGAIRLSCFAGDAFILKEDSVVIDDTETKRLWVRPACVVDVSPEAVKFMESYLLFRLISNPNDMQHAIDNFPELLEKLTAALKEKSNGLPKAKINRITRGKFTSYK